MKQLVISRIIFSAIIRGRSRSKRICIPRCRAYCSRIHPIVLDYRFSLKNLRSLAGTKRILKSIQSKSNNKLYEECRPINGWVSQKCCDKQTKSSQNKSMMPKKAYRLDGVIKHLLHFMHRFNLHVLLIDIFHKYIIPIQFLKIHVITQKMRVMNIEKLPKKHTFQEVLI
jgi:hypothetical protein